MSEEPQKLWAVQFASGGIPQDPYLLDSHENALRLFVETAVANDLEFTQDSTETWIGNDDDEVRLFGPIHVWSKLAPPAMSEWKGDGFVDRPFDADELAEVERILSVIREKEKAA